MPRSATTGIYTRVDNSFSNPVVGTTISPTDADTFFDDVEASINSFMGTSTTSLAIATGSKTFTIASSASTKAFLVGMQIHAFSLANSANYMDCTVVSYNTSTGALVTTCFAVGGSGTINDWVIFSAGARGGAGPIAGFRQTYDISTTDADPGDGDFRLNHATPASATAAYFDNADTGGTSLTTILDALDDHGNSSARGILRAEKESDAAVWAQWLVSGSVVDGTGYRKVTLSGGSGSGAFTATDAFRFAFYPKGSDGTLGGSTGSTDNAVLRADGTGGGTAQSSAVSIDDSGNITGVGTLDIGNADTTISRTGAGAIAVEGVGVALNSISLAHTAGTIELGHASDTTISRSAAGVIAVEGVPLYSNVPQNSQSAAYTTVLADAQKHILHPSSDNNARTFTIDSNANVAYPIGTAITFVNQINTVTISIASDTMTLAGAGTTGSRTLAANGIATALKVGTTSWIISGTGLT
jgi:hypothetical protein